ncbi:MAG: hypothetical protein AAFY20_15150 [Cyanobacteria bacterium J06639_14]
MTEAIGNQRIHTITSITNEVGRDRKTVQRWVAKAKAESTALSEFGEMRGGTRYFNDTERNLITSYKCDRVSAKEVEVIPGAEYQPFEHQSAITRASNVAAPLVPINIESLNITIQTSNTAQLEGETLQFQGVNAQGLGAIGELIQADLRTTVHNTIAQNRHAVAGMSAKASVDLVNELGKPSEPLTEDPAVA